MGKLIEALYSLPKPYKAGLLIGVLFVVFLLIGGTMGIVSHFKDRAFDKREAEREEQRQVLEDERNMAIGKALALEKQAADLASQTRILEVTIAAQGSRAEQAKEALENEDKRYQEELAAIGAPVDPVEQCKRLCAKLRVKDCPCD